MYEVIEDFRFVDFGCGSGCGIGFLYISVKLVSENIFPQSTEKPLNVRGFMVTTHLTLRMEI